MPTSSAAVTGTYEPVLVPDQNYNRLEREDAVPQSVDANVDAIPEVPSIANDTDAIPAVSSTVSDGGRMKTILLIGAVILGIGVAGVLPGVIVSQVLITTATIDSSTSTASTNSTTSGNNTTVSSSNSTSNSSTSTNATTTVCPTNVCSYPSNYSFTSSGYYGVEQVFINCTQALSNITAFIVVQKQLVLFTLSNIITFWSGVVNQMLTNTTTQLIYSWTIVPGQTVSASGFPYFIEAQFQLQGTNQTVANDTFAVMTQSACNGQVLTYSGHF